MLSDSYGWYDHDSCNKYDWYDHWTKRNSAAAHYLHVVQVVLSCSGFVSILFSLSQDLDMHWHKGRKMEVFKYLVCPMNCKIKYLVLIWLKFCLTVWDCQRQIPLRLLLFPKMANFWYFTDTSVHHFYIPVLSIRCSLPLSVVTHTLMVLRDPQQDECPRGLGALVHWLSLKEKLRARKTCAPFLHIENWCRSKETYSRRHRQSMVGLGTESRFPESYPVS